MAPSFFSSKIIHTFHQILCILCLMTIILVYFAFQCFFFSFSLQDPLPHSNLNKSYANLTVEALAVVNYTPPSWPDSRSYVYYYFALHVFLYRTPLPPNSDLNNFYANLTVLALAVVNYTPSSWPGSRDYVYCYLIDTP